jgi:WD40 repeat protein
MNLLKVLALLLIPLGVLGAAVAVVWCLPDPDGTVVCAPNRVVHLLRHGHWVHGVAFAPDSRSLASAAGSVNGGGGEVKVWDLATGRERASYSVGAASAESVAFSPDGKALAAATYRGQVHLWDTATGKQGRLFKLDQDDGRTVAFTADGKRLLAGGYATNPGWAWDLSAEGKGQSLPGCGPFALAPDGRTLAVTSQDMRTVQVCDFGTGAVLGTFPETATPATSLAISPDGSLLASAEYAPEVRLWEVGTQRRLAPLRGHVGPVLSVAFSPDGRTLATAGQDRTVRLWEVPSGRRKATLTGHEGPVESVAFSGDGRRLASGSYDKTVRVWDLSGLR